jgi:excisionase family DNA binding protein
MFFMNEVMLFPMEPREFWQQLRKMIEEIVEENNASKAARATEVQPLKTLLKAKEICELFQVSKPTVYEWMRQGKLQSVKIRSRRYFLLQDVEQLIKSSHSLFTPDKPVHSSTLKA